MRALLLPATLLLTCAACGTTAPAPDMEAMNRRVTSLERRVNELEQNKGGPRPKPPGPAAGEGGDGEGEAPAGGAAPIVKVEVKAEGDAKRVVVKKGKRPFVLPAQVPVGEGTIWATFEEGVDPTEVGKITLVEGKPAVVVCTSADKTCKPKP